MKIAGTLALAFLYLATDALAAQIAPITLTPAKSTVFRLLASDDLWYFNQITTLLNYRTTIGLNAIGPDKGTFSWEATTNPSAVKFENGATSISKTDDSTLRVTSREISLIRGDVTLRLRYNGALVGDYPLTVFAPSQRQFRNALLRDDRATKATPGFVTSAVWELRDQFGFSVPKALEVNEFFDRDTITDIVQPNNWHSPSIPNADLPPNGKLTEPFGNSLPAFFLDEYTRAGGDFDPLPQNPPFEGPLSTVEVFNVRQRYFAGSELPGQGRQQRAQIAHFYLDHADPVVIP